MRTILLLFVFLLGFHVHSQTDTLSFSKERKFKHSLSLNGSMTYAFFSHIIRNMWSDGIYKSKPFGGIEISYLHSTSYRFAYGLEMGVHFMDVFVDRNARTSNIINSNLLIGHEGIDVVSFSLIPKIRWKTRKNNNMTGFYHEFGAGVTISKPIEKDYSYELLNLEDLNSVKYINSFYDSEIANQTYNPSQLYDYSHDPYLGLVLFYDLSDKGKISKNLLWSVGIRTQLNLSYRLLDGNLSYFGSPEKEHFWVSNLEMEGLIARSQFLSPFALNFGLVYNL